MIQADTPPKRQKWPVSAYTLKLIAVVSMLTDHIALALRPLLAYGTFRTLRHVGRFALPLFCFLLVEGLRHTHSRVKYLRNLVAFAVISELPSDLFFRTWATRGEGMSIFATLTLGLLVLTASETFTEKCRERDMGAVPAVLFFFAASSGAIYLAGLLRVEYGEWGVGLILMIYLGEQFSYDLSARLHWGGKARGIGASVAILIWMVAFDVAADWKSEVYGLPVLLLILLYNGERGSYRLPKWSFYAFYPLHLCILLLLRLRFA